MRPSRGDRQDWHFHAEINIGGSRYASYWVDTTTLPGATNGLDSQPLDVTNTTSPLIFILKTKKEEVPKKLYKA